MSYVQARFKKKKPPANPILVGCGGTIYLAVLYALSYLGLRLLGSTISQVRPEILRKIAAIPALWNFTVAGNNISIPISDNLILFVECTLVVMILLGLTMSIYSIFYDATRDKESWELYAEEAERQARSNKGR